MTFLLLFLAIGGFLLLAIGLRPFLEHRLAGRGATPTRRARRLAFWRIASGVVLGFAVFAGVDAVDLHGPAHALAFWGGWCITTLTVVFILARLTAPPKRYRRALVRKAWHPGALAFTLPAASVMVFLGWALRVSPDAIKLGWWSVLPDQLLLVAMPVLPHDAVGLGNRHDPNSLLGRDLSPDQQARVMVEVESRVASDRRLLCPIRLGRLHHYSATLQRLVQENYQGEACRLAAATTRQERESIRLWPKFEFKSEWGGFWSDRVLSLPTDVRARLAELLFDADRRVQVDAMVTLSLCGDGAMPWLREMLDFEETFADQDGYWDATWALGHLVRTSDACWHALERYSQTDPDPRVRSTAAGVIDREQDRRPGTHAR